MSEMLNFSPNPAELVVQDGPNKGAIADVELAEIGAYAEKAAREQHKILQDRWRYRNDEKPSYKKNPDMTGELPQQLENVSIGFMRLEVGKRAIDTMIKSGANIDITGDKGVDFRTAASQEFADNQRSKIAEKAEDNKQ